MYILCVALALQSSCSLFVYSKKRNVDGLDSGCIMIYDCKFVITSLNTWFLSPTRTRIE